MDRGWLSAAPLAPLPGCADSEAVVDEVGFDLAHDSDGLRVVTLRFPNGARSQRQLEGDAILRVIGTLGSESVQDLVGRPFSELAPGLPVNAERLPDPLRSR